MRVAILIVTLCACAGARGPAAGAANAEAPPAEQHASGDEVVCRKERVVGSRFKKEVCYSKATAATRRDIDQKVVRDVRPVPGSGF